MKTGTIAALSAVASAATAVAVTLVVQEYRHDRAVRELKRSIPDVPTPQVPQDVGQAAVAAGAALAARRHDEAGIEVDAGEEYPAELVAEQLARTAAFFGDEGLAAIRAASVVVVGCGGVGSWVATMLARNGVGRVRLIDFDQVTLSSLNRHAAATVADVGTPKVAALARYLGRVAPFVRIESRNTLWTLAEAEELLLEGGRPDFVVDAIDNIETKVDLLEFCVRHDLRVVSSMGAACKADVTRINIGDISATQEDGLARATRRRLKLRGITSGVPVVFSSEKPGPDKPTLLPLADEVFAAGKVDELSVMPDFRVRILPVLGTMPGVFGLAAATYVLTTLAGMPVEYIEQKARVKVYDAVLHALSGQSMRLTGSQQLPFDANDITYLVEEVFRGKSVVSGVAANSRVALSQWDPARPLALDNVVLLTKDEAKAHERDVLVPKRAPGDVYGAAVLSTVAARQAEEACYRAFR
ncbi:uncharacterized protein V1510DRAFT_418593 [Dipodascopsis tothii]|uniref:uncharacterized protein n=1 Tax=Dipodascopsis tothii TaxID=44089 RepID=UPI0034CE1DDC